MFITFEGVEGSGKSTQIQMLVKALTDQGFFVETTREPGGTPIGDQIRKVLLDSANAKMVPLCEMLLYWAARAQHIAEKIGPWQQEGKVVICDRYIDSTVVYQGYARELDMNVIRELEQLVAKDMQPDLTFVIDVPVEEGLKRARARMEDLVDKEDRFENEVIEFHHKVQDGFLDLAEKNPNRILVVDGLQSIEDLHGQILGLALERIKERDA